MAKIFKKKKKWKRKEKKRKRKGTPSGKGEERCQELEVVGARKFVCRPLEEAAVVADAAGVASYYTMSYYIVLLVGVL